MNELVRYGSCTYREIAELAANGAVAVVPLGCTEQQGPHLPVDFDSWFAETLMLESAEQVEVSDGPRVLVLPAIPLGPTPEHRGFGAGFLDLPAEQHEAVVRAVVESLIAQGFRDVVVWRGCGQHELRGTVEALNAAHAPARVHLPDSPSMPSGARSPIHPWPEVMPTASRHRSCSPVAPSSFDTP